MPEHLLLVEDSADDALLLQSTLDGRHPGQYAIVNVATLKEAKAAVWQQTFAAVLLDLSLPDSQGLKTIGGLAAAAPNLPIVVLTGVADEAVAREAVRCGAQDYLVKGQANATSIDQAIHYAVDRKQAEEALGEQRRELEAKNKELQETQRRLEAYRDRYVDLYDFAPLGYVTLDEEGYVQEINLAGAQLLNADRDVLTGYPFSQHVAKEDMPVFLDHLRKCVDGQCEMTSELRLAARGGRLITVQLRSIPVKGLAEDVTFYKTAITDITQRKEMEETIRRSGAFLQTVIDAIPDVMLVIGTDYRIVLANRAAREMAGGVDPTVGLACHQLSHHRDLPCTGKDEPCPLRQVIVTKAPVTVMHTHYGADGKERFVEVSAAPVLDEAGEVSYIIEACRDVSERKRAEEALQRTAEDLARSNAELEQFAYVASHDLQEPLRTVSRFVQLLQQKYGNRLDAEAGQLIEYAVDSAKRMEALITGLLAYSRIGGGRLELTPTDAGAALHLALSNLQTSIQETAAEITNGELPTVRADGTQLVQLFQNLIGNALKFRGVAPLKIHVDACRNEDHWLFSVRDNGIGIDPQHRDRIFQIFERQHTGKQCVGTCIGLAVCKRIVDCHGGRIWVESEPEQGATFSFTLPT